MTACGLLAAILLYFCFFDRLGALGLVGPDEPRYASVARTMAATGDWVTPRLHGQPWFEKPILYYWAAATSFRLFGVSEASARLPSAVAAAVITLTLAWAAWHFYGAAAAGIALLIFPTCVAAIGFARAATTDMLFAASLTLAMAAAARVVFAGRASPGDMARPRVVGARPAPQQAPMVWHVAFGVFLALAALAKGPAAIVLAGGSIGLWMLMTRRWKDAFRTAHPAAVLAFCVVALPWYVLCAMRNPEFVNTFLISHNIQRYLTPMFQHDQPFWFFAPILLLGLVPWTVLLIAPARDAVCLWREKGFVTSPAFFFACWAIFSFLFFSFSRSKLPGYMLPVVPPVVLLMVRSAARVYEQREALARWLAVGTGATVLALAASVGLWMNRLPPEGGTETVQACAIVVACLGAAIVAVGLLRRSWLALVLTGVVACGIVASINRLFIPEYDAGLSARAASERFSAQASPSETVRVYRVYRVHRAWHYGFNYYFNRELPEWSPETPTRGLVITSDIGVRDLRSHGIRFQVEDRVAPQATLVRIE